MSQTSNTVLVDTYLNYENPIKENETVITNLFTEKNNIPESDDAEIIRYIKRPIEKDYIEALMVYTEQNLADPNLTLKFISEKVLFMNTDYISKQFIKEVGVRYTAYLSHLRIEKAKTLIPMLGKKKIHRVAEEIGFGNSPQYFSRIFKKNTGLTPTEYLQQTKQMLKEKSL